MELSQDDVCEFQALYLAQFGVELSAEEAREKALEVIALVRLLHGLDDIA